MKYLTFLNSGCLDICKNMLKSAENVGISLDDFYIACLDRNVFNSLSEYKNVYLYIDQDIQNYENWTYAADSGFRKVIQYKWNIIKEFYKTQKTFCYVDTDIVFLKNPLALIENSNKVLLQNGGNKYSPYISSGFMVFNSSMICENIIDDCANAIGEDDQLIINKIVHKYPGGYEILDDEQFANGLVFYIEGRNKNAYIVHNTHHIGKDIKIDLFKNNGMWYIN